MNVEVDSRTRFFWYVLLAILGLALSLSLLSLHTHVAVHKNVGQGYVSPCDISETINCSKVELSSWSKIGGVPLAAAGAGFYISLAMTGFVAGAEVGLSVAALSGLLLIPLSIGLFIVAKFFVGSLCLFCLGTYLCNLGIAIVPLLQGEGALKDKYRMHAGRLRRFSELRQLPIVGTVVCTGLISILLSTLAMNAVVGVGNQRKELSEFRKDGMLDELLALPKAEFSLVLEAGDVDKDFSLGPKTAAVEIVEFADFQCPACQYSYGMFRRLVVEYRPHVRFVFKNYPLDQACNSSIKREFHKFSCAAAQLARCAGEQGQYFKMADNLMLDRLFPETGDSDFWGFVSKKIPALKGLDSLNVEELERCFVSQRHMGKIRSDVEQGNLLEITSTPTVFLNHWRLENSDEATVRAYIEATLRKRGVML
jgi:protein-disulfide isomerase/uncharacterized membrane protein